MDTEIIQMQRKSQGTFWERASFWKLASAKLICLCFISVCSSITASMNGIVSFYDMTGPQIFLAVVALVAAVASTVLAFLSETMANLNAKAAAEKKAKAAK